MLKNCLNSIAVEYLIRFIIFTFYLSSQKFKIEISIASCEEEFSINLGRE